jgi:hypothetical protein
MQLAFRQLLRAYKVDSSTAPSLVCAEQNKAVNVIAACFEQLDRRMQEADSVYRAFALLHPASRCGPLAETAGQSFGANPWSPANSILFTTAGHFAAKAWRQKPMLWANLYLDEANHMSMLRLAAFSTHTFQGHWYLSGGASVLISLNVFESCPADHEQLPPTDKRKDKEDDASFLYISLLAFVAGPHFRLKPSYRFDPKYAGYPW